jgi:hypothetical protein
MEPGACARLGRPTHVRGVRRGAVDSGSTHKHARRRAASMWCLAPRAPHPLMELGNPHRCWCGARLRVRQLNPPHGECPRICVGVSEQEPQARAAFMWCLAPRAPHHHMGAGIGLGCRRRRSRRWHQLTGRAASCPDAGAGPAEGRAGSWPSRSPPAGQGAGGPRPGAARPGVPARLSTRTPGSEPAAGGHRSACAT